MAGLFATWGLAASADAQSKYPGQTLPEPAAPSLYRPPAATPPQAPASPTSGHDAAAESLARQLPLDPSTRDLRDRLPPNIPAVEQQLGLREPHGPVIDLRGRTPTPAEIQGALSGKQ